jgi:hypothetical protein
MRRFFFWTPDGVFAGGFRKNHVLDVVFLWFFDGKCVVKDGALMAFFTH